MLRNHRNITTVRRPGFLSLTATTWQANWPYICNSHVDQTLNQQFISTTLKWCNLWNLHGWIEHGAFPCRIANFFSHRGIEGSLKMAPLPAGSPLPPLFRSQSIQVSQQWPQPTLAAWWCFIWVCRFLRIWQPEQHARVFSVHTDGAVVSPPGLCKKLRHGLKRNICVVRIVCVMS